VINRIFYIEGMLNLKNNIKRLLFIYKKCKTTGGNFFLVYSSYLYRKLKTRKNIIAHEKVCITGLKNIEIEKGSFLEIGLKYVGFIHPNDNTLLNIRGKLHFKSSYSIGRGCRIDIGENAKVVFGKGGYTNSFTKFIISHGLTIGDNCIISWDCQFLDDDFHKIQYEGKQEKVKEIKIGNNVWIGCGVKIYQGTIIPNNTVISANSIVRGVFNEENTIILGNLAKVIKTNVSWNL